eukprot:5783271-Amphidinium_carterae.2
MPLLSPAVPPMTLPSHTLESPFHFYTHNEKVIKDDFPRLSPYVELLLLGYLRINHVIQEAMCLSPHLYSRDDADHSTQRITRVWLAAGPSPARKTVSTIR